jgi:FAD/FMN-containing dehydrogenase
MFGMTRRTFLRTGAAATLGLSGAIELGPNVRPASRHRASAQTPEMGSALDDLRARLNGTLILPGDSGYLAASAPANGRYLEIRPMAIARCADEADVVTCIDWCNENGVSPVGRGGGHSYAGYSTTTGLMIDIRRLNSVTIDKREGTVVCGGAALNNDFFIATEDSPLFLPGGTCLGVGVGGLTLGGGIGYNTHWAGLTCDHMVTSRIVTADAEPREIDSANNADLYWACRGGAGGNFGINTQFTFNLVEVPQSSIGFYRFDWYGAEAAAAVLTAFDTLLTTIPDAMNCVAMAEAIDAEDGDPQMGIHVMSRGQYIGPVDELRELVQPLLDAATPGKQTLEETSFWDVQRLIATPEPPSHSFGDISRYAADPLPQDAIADMVDRLVECPSKTDDANGSIWSLGWVGGGMVDTFSRTETAYVHRNMHTLWRPTTVWPDDADPSVGDDLNAWTDSIIDILAPNTPSESYQNFPNRSLDDWAEQYYAENFQRLVEVKAAYDPANLFHNPQSIPVSAN